MGLHYYSSSFNIRIVCNCWIAFCLGSPSIIESIVIPVLWQRSHLNNHIIVIKSISLSVGVLCRALYLHLQSCTFILSSMSSHLISTRWVEGRATGKLIRYYRRCGWKGTHLRIAGRRAARFHHSSHSLSCYARPGWDGWWFYITATIQWYYTFFQMNHKVCVFKI